MLSAARPNARYASDLKAWPAWRDSDLNRFAFVSSLPSRFDFPSTHVRLQEREVSVLLGNDVKHGKHIESLLGFLQAIAYPLTTALRPTAVLFHLTIQTDLLLP